ncbi:hypothetical protein HBH56_166620 [Parastagonospora nodorum]|uniref:Uncharacterized protein n=1 Tax=Phaeosphaeria nodorum (strain SN15 / ATCC MYA-4574 / FGSC 10173) TaxID=321614 RepID=A0A7U2I408_PHANO|nr:hypothetical protein HBH56_166620 [Parastagonospora nodorum]QRC98562.1 hypothetical protein JI435_046130 [Parastagonospora nodorum SN15]KAH3936250.1 hypothetical protein HBH54_029700 [Parastagonospora nodorum]KAH3968690.1 hypothetical protein HBH51_128410 [Parastagonospora nodorum]KAH3989463.1 hypothetical protein HBH52_013550 [Parastagonospora nodorum]
MSPILPKVTPPEVLMAYTGLYRDDTGARIAVTLDAGQLRIGYFTGTPSILTKSIDISIDHFRLNHVEGDTEEELKLNSKVMAVAIVLRAKDTVMFKVKKGEIVGLSVDGKAYERTKRGACRILELSAELRNRIWTYALMHASGGDRVVLQQPTRDGYTMITGDLKRPWNLVRCAHKQFRQDARLLEFASNSLICSNGSALVKLLRPVKNPEIVRWLRKLVFIPNWGWGRWPEEKVLYSVVDFARLVPDCRVMIIPYLWHIKDSKFTAVRDYIKMGIALRQAMRVDGGRRMPAVVDAVKHLRAGRTAEELDCTKIKFYPFKTKTDTTKSLKLACKSRVMDPILIWYVGEDGKKEAEHMIKADILRWLKEGI